MPKRKLISFGVVALVAIAGYFINVEVQSHLGRKAIKALNLEEITFAQALEKAKTAGKPVLADYSAVWCPGCRKMDQRVLADPDVRAKIDAGYVFVRIESESDEGVAFSKKYGVRATPSLVVLNSEGEAQRRLPYTLDPQKFIQSL